MKTSALIIGCCDDCANFKQPLKTGDSLFSFRLRFIGATLVTWNNDESKYY